MDITPHDSLLYPASSLLPLQKLSFVDLVIFAPERVMKHYNGSHSCPSTHFIVQELCENRGGRPGLSVLTSLLVSVDVKIY